MSVKRTLELTRSDTQPIAVRKPREMPGEHVERNQNSFTRDVAAMAGLDMAACLIILTLAPVITIVGYEVAGHRHRMAALERSLHEGEATR